MKAIYKASDDSMHEQPDRKGTMMKKEYDEYFGRKESVTPCAKPHNWQDGREYELGKDFYIGTGADTNWKDFVYPFSPPSNDEDKLWKNVIEIVLDNDYEPLEKIVKILNRGFHITLKPTQ